ncbi:MAG: hypothetical protein JWQ61_2407 [Collimonas fungivorans]|uniref:hypothetical protein n=1 Tax=Collimonas fungivorans TaxID=158899 RepID=UPI0026F01BE8|nr:hypothetical protein [Collimonas fungivorans]MDB5767593.1 hypothetical protein [Collimonas fungivorans]
MSRLTVFSLILGMALALAGCKPSAPTPQVFKAQTDALEKAKGVEQQLQQAQDKAKAAEEEQQK